LSTYGEREEYAVDADVEFSETGKSTVPKCVVCGAVSKRSGSTVKINSSSYGFITINDKTYHRDVYVLPSGKVVEREYGHTFTEDQAERVLKETPTQLLSGRVHLDWQV